MRIYKDADASILEGKTIAVIGYGPQGRAQALNWKDSGLRVIIGLRKNSRSKQTAEAEGFEVKEILEAAREADVIALLCSDTAMQEVYEKIKPALQKGKTLYFSHGFAIVFGLVKPEPWLDIVMLAPKGPGKAVRKNYLSGEGMPALVAVHQDSSGNALQTVLALAKAQLFTQKGVLECTFREETITDLFGEQSVLCGGVAELMKNAFEVLVEKGYPPALAYFEVMHELKLTVDLIHKSGLAGMWNSVSQTACYGGLTRGKQLITAETKKKMRKILSQIESGEFAKEVMRDYAHNRAAAKKLLSKEKKHLSEKIGKRIREEFMIGGYE